MKRRTLIAILLIGLSVLFYYLNFTVEGIWFKSGGNDSVRSETSITFFFTYAMASHSDLAFAISDDATHNDIRRWFDSTKPIRRERVVDRAGGSGGSGNSWDLFRFSSGCSLELRNAKVQKNESGHLKIMSWDKLYWDPCTHMNGSFK